MREFVIGSVYYFTVFTDRNFLYPCVCSYVFLGSDIYGDETASKWYFQDCDSYGRLGSVANDRVKQEVSMLALSIETLEEMLDEQELPRALAMATGRRTTMRKP